MMLVFDVNALLDYYGITDYPEDQKAATELITALSSQETAFIITPTVLKDFRYLFSTLSKRRIRAEKGTVTESEAAAVKITEKAAADHLMDIATIASENLSTCEMARTLYNQHPDYEDCLIAAVALRIGADCIVTRDKAFAKHCPVACYTPAEALPYVESGVWD